MADVLDLGTLAGRLSLDSKAWDNPLTRAAAGMEGFKGKALLATAAVGGAAIGVGVALYKVGSVFDDLSDTIRATTGASGKELDGLVASAKRIGTEVPASFDEIGPVVSALNQRLGLTGPVLEKLAEQFLEYGRISGEALDPKTVTAALNVFNVKGSESSKVLDEMFRVSQQTGVGLNELTASVARGGPILTQYGFSIGEAANLLGNLDKAGIDGGRTTQALAKAMSVFAKEGKNPRKALEDTITGIQGYIKSGDQASAIKLAGKIFGTRGAAQFVAAVKSGKLSVDSLTSSAYKHGDSILKAGKDTADFSEQWQLFKNRALVQVEPVASRVFAGLASGMAWVNSTGAPALASLSDNFADVAHVIATVTGFLASHRTAIMIVAGVITALLLPAIIAWGVQSLLAGKRNLMAWVSAKVGAASSAAMQVASLTLLTLQWVRSGVAAMAGAARQVAAWVLSKLGVAGTIALYGVAFAFMAAGWIASAAASMAGAVAMAAAWFIALGPIGWAIAAIAVIVALVIRYWDQISAFTKAAWSAISGAVSAAVSWVIDFVKAHWPLILAIITGPIGLAVLAVVRNMDRIKAFMSAAWNAVKSAAKAAWNGITGVISAGANAIMAAVRAIPGKLKSLVSSFGSAGKALINAFVNGMKNAGGIISGIAGNVWNAVKKLLNGAIGKLRGALNFTIGIPGPDIHVNVGSKIPYLADGGYADKATLGVFGEAGPEVVLPLNSGKAKAAMAHLAGSEMGPAELQPPIQVTQNITTHETQDNVQVGNAASERLMFKLGSLGVSTR